MPDRCDHTGLLKSECAHCHPPAPEPVEPLETVGRPFEATYIGECEAGCGKPIYPGQSIARTAETPPGRPSAYVHAAGCAR